MPVRAQTMPTVIPSVSQHEIGRYKIVGNNNLLLFDQRTQLGIGTNATGRYYALVIPVKT